MFDRDGVKLKYVLQKRRIILLSFFLLITNNLDFVSKKSHLLIRVKRKINLVSDLQGLCCPTLHLDKRFY